MQAQAGIAARWSRPISYCIPASAWFPHGLRKGAMSRLAEYGSTSKEIAAMSGHRSLKEIERYTAAADQARLARSAGSRLPEEQNDDT